MKTINLYDEKNLNDLEAWQVGIYNQLIRLENDCNNWLLDIGFDRLLDGINKLLEIKPHEKKDGSKAWTLSEKLVEGKMIGWINQNNFLKACKSITKKEKLERLITESKEKEFINKERKPGASDKKLLEMDILQEKIKQDVEYIRLLKLKEKYKKIKWARLLERIRNLENKIKYRYALI